MTSFWYPFRSKIAAEICAHLTDKEVRALRRLTFSYGTIAGVGIAGASSLSRSLFVEHHSEASASAAFLVALTASAATAWLLTIPMRSKMRALLASTAYAKERGWDAVVIRLYSFWNA